MSFRLNKRTIHQPAVLLCILLVSSLSLNAADRLTLTLGDLGDETWQARSVILQADLQPHQDQYILSVEEIHHPALSGGLQMLRFDCQSGRIAHDRISCEKGVLDLTLDGQRLQGIISRINWNITTQAIDIKINNIKIAHGKLALSLQTKQQQWRLILEGKGLDIQQLGTLHQRMADPVAEFSLAGNLDLWMKLQGQGTQLLAGNSRVDFRGTNFSDTAGNYIGQGLAGSWQGQTSLVRGGWAGAQELALNAGELLTPQIYLSPATHPLSLETTYHYQTTQGLISLEPFSFNQPGRLSFTGGAEVSLLDEPHVRALDLTSETTEIAPLFRDNLLPVLASPPLEDLELAGKFSLNLSHQENITRVAVGLRDIHIEQGMQMRGDGRGQFALYGLDGEINWSNAAVKESHLSWKGGHLFGDISLGAAILDMNLSGNRISLAKQATIPVLDGELRAENFELEQGATGPKLHFQGYLTPISMAAISTAVGWPPLAGQLSGMIPGLSYEQGVIAVDGVALFQLFDGAIVVRDLKLDDLFGALPALSADLEFKDINLETLTRAFSFGKITGKLAGRVDDLRLEEWTPVSFDAAFATPADDDSRHRINQKAVDNISNLGGAGVSGAISRSFLRFFEEFGYDRLGISCRLERGICHMGGIENTDKGYYLVKGGGIPRIDIMGFNRKTDWQVLVSKLKQITSGGAPVIQ